MPNSHRHLDHLSSRIWARRLASLGQRFLGDEVGSAWLRYSARNEVMAKAIRGLRNRMKEVLYSESKGGNVEEEQSKSSESDKRHTMIVRGRRRKTGEKRRKSSQRTAPARSWIATTFSATGHEQARGARLRIDSTREGETHWIA